MSSPRVAHSSLLTAALLASLVACSSASDPVDVGLARPDAGLARPDAATADDAADAAATDATSDAASADAGPTDAEPTDAGGETCSANPMTHLEIINACTDVAFVEKTVSLPLLNPDGTLPALP
jgi:hypothetical protein